MLFSHIAMQIPILIIVLGIPIWLAFPIRITTDEQKRKLNVARVLTAVFPGLGYIYFGNWVRGIVYAVLWVALVISTIQNGLRALQNSYESANFTASICILLVFWLLGFIGLSGWRKSKKNKQEKAMKEKVI